MKLLFVLAALLIGYGSFYPFDFRAEPLPARVLLEPSPMGRGDLLQNLALFLPFGYLGMVAWARPRRPLRFAIVIAAAAVYGAALQVVQLWLPARDPALRDVLPNTLGAVLGALVGSVAAFDVRRLGGRAAPLVLALFWIAYRLLPFVPTIDWQKWKDGLKPLLRDWSPFPWVGAAHDASAWLAFACLWAAASPATLGWLPLLAMATLGAEVLIVSNWLSPANVLGAAIGLSLWPLVARLPRRTAFSAALLAAAIALHALAPFELAPEPVGFTWVPFGGFLGGSMLINAQNLFEKAFFYGALVWLLREAGLRLAWAGGVAAGFLLAIEALQTRFLGHTPEITDPLFAAFAALFLGFADRPCPRDPPISLQSACAKEDDV